jgi:hypothetical protein
MDLAEIRLIRLVVINERGAEVFRKKSGLSPSCESQYLAIRHLIANCGFAS